MIKTWIPLNEFLVNMKAKEKSICDKHMYYLNDLVIQVEALGHAQSTWFTTFLIVVKKEDKGHDGA